jgi:hypothetical protein
MPHPAFPAPVKGNSFGSGHSHPLHHGRIAPWINRSLGRRPELSGDAPAFQARARFEMHAKPHRSLPQTFPKTLPSRLCAG